MQNLGWKEKKEYKEPKVNKDEIKKEEKKDEEKKVNKENGKEKEDNKMNTDL